MNFATIFRRIRKELNFTQAEFAYRLSVSRSAIAQIETSKNKPSKNIIEDILTNFNISSSLKNELKNYVDLNEEVNVEVNNKNNISDSKKNIGKDLMDLHSEFSRTIISLEKVLHTVYRHGFYDGFDEKEIEIIKDLQEYIMIKPILILTNKLPQSIEEYTDELELKLILANDLLHSYIDLMFEKINNLEQGSKLVIDLDSMINKED